MSHLQVYFHSYSYSHYSGGGGDYSDGSWITPLTVEVDIGILVIGGLLVWALYNWNKYQERKKRERRRGRKPNNEPQ